MMNRTASLFALLAAGARLGSAELSARRDLPPMASMLRSLSTGAALRSRVSHGVMHSPLHSVHNRTARREWSRYPLPVPPAQQHNANARRAARGW